MLVDLPGYGYAQVPEAIRAPVAAPARRPTCTRRPNLIGLVLIMDSRHPLTRAGPGHDRLVAPSGRPIHVLLTKSDKLTRSAAAATLAAVRKELAPIGPQVTVQLFSSLKKTGVEEVERVVGWVAFVFGAGSCNLV